MHECYVPVAFAEACPCGTLRRTISTRYFGRLHRSAYRACLALASRAAATHATHASVNRIYGSTARESVPIFGCVLGFVVVYAPRQTRCKIVVSGRQGCALTWGWLGRRHRGGSALAAGTRVSAHVPRKFPTEPLPKLIDDEVPRSQLTVLSQPARSPRRASSTRSGARRGQRRPMDGPRRRRSPPHHRPSRHHHRHVVAAACLLLTQAG